MRRSTCWHNRSPPRRPCTGCSEDDLFALTRKAWPYRALSRTDFDLVIAMVSDGFATPRGRRSALVHRDEVNHMLRGRRGSRLLSLVSGGAIPEVADYRVVLEPEDTFIGTVNEDFAIESLAGDIFQLGNASWQITQVLLRYRACARCAGRTADDPVLARRGAGAQRRAVARRVRFARWCRCAPHGRADANNAAVGESRRSRR
jgi:hypothetical protein